MFYKRIALFFIIISALAFPAASLDSAPDFSEMLEEIDKLGTFENNDFSCIYTIVAEKPGEEKNVVQARMFRRDAKDQFVLLILKPDVQKGQGYLQVDDNLWFYDPESRKFSHASIKENIQGSDAKNSDVRRNSLSEDYEVESWSESTLGKHDVYVLELVARHNEVAYPRLKLWVKKDQTIVLKAENYSLSNRLMRTAYYPSYVKVEDRYIPSKLLFIDELREGEKTQMTIKEPSLQSLPDSVFTKAFLERVNK